MPNSAPQLIPFPLAPRPYVRPPRILRRVTRAFPRAAQLSPGYFVRWWIQTLECGHKIHAYNPEQQEARRRACRECANAAKLIPFPKRPAA